MATTDNTIVRDINVVFSDSRTNIGRGLQQIEHALVINVIPNTEGNNIARIDIIYNGRQYGQILDPEIFEALVTSLRTTGSTLLERIVNYIDNLPNDEFQTIIQQYGLYIEDGIIIDGIIGGIAAYLVLLLINERNISSLTPFSFLAPTDLQSGNSVNRNMFRVLTVPLAALLRSNNKVMVQLASFVSSFINIWDSLFIEGPIMPEVNDIRIAIDIISQITQNIPLTVDEKIQVYINNTVNELVEQRLQHYTTELNKALVNLATINNIPKYSSVISETVYERSHITETDDTSKITPRPTQRNNRYIAQPTKIQSTGRISSPLPWRR